MAKLRVDKIAAPIVKDEFTGSVYFDGTGDKLSVPNSEDFRFGSDDFTLEAWIRVINPNSDWDSVVGMWDSSETRRTFALQRKNSDGQLYLYVSTDGGSTNWAFVNGGNIATDTWYHVAGVRDGNTLKAFINGSLVGTASYSDSILNNTTDALFIGDVESSDTNNFSGYISNLRICKGHAVYTENFTPPTRELEVHTGAKGVVFPAADNRTVLLTCQSSTDATAEATGRHILTAAGNTTAADANPGLFRKTNITSTITENTGSVFFDGSGDKLQIADSTDFEFGSNSFTIEFWVYPTSFAATDVLVIKRDGATYAPFYLYINNGTLTFYSSSNGSSWDIASAYSFGHSLTLNVWQHIVLTRNNNEITAYLNGVRGNTITTSASLVDNAHPLGIGGDPGNADSSSMTGYISNFRICKGKALYTSNFAPPTTELEVTPETVLVCCHDGENIFAEKTGKIIAAYGDRTSSPTPTATDSPIGITTNNPGLTRSVDATAGPTFQGGAGFVSQNWLTLPKGTTTERYAGSNSASPAPRGLRASGQTPSITNTVDSVEIATTGDALDFGDLITSKFGAGGIGSPTRGLFCGGGTPTRQTAIDYFTISTRGNGQDFGDIFGDARTLAGATGGNATRGLTFGGATSSGTSNVICAITISSTGSVSDFGDCTKQNGSAVVCSPTRAVSAGGDSAANGSNINTIDFVTIQTFGNSFDFGDLAAAGSGRGVSSATRGLFSTGAPSATNTINYVTIATTSNSVDFGDLISNNISGGCASYSSLTRGCFAGIRTPTVTNTIEYFTISTLGDALNFGDLTQSVNNGGGLSNGHGGLG
jgi:hypothetical protein